MADRGLVIFDTRIGPCGLAWGPAGICAVQLPERDRHATSLRLTRREPDLRPADPPGAVRRAIEALRRLLDGAHDDLSWIELDFAGIEDWRRRVYSCARQIPPGETRTYGEVAAAVGAGTEARAVGRAMARNPFTLIVPCHRVVAANGKLGGFSATGGAVLKRRLLAAESRWAAAADPPRLFDGAAAF